ncbi:MAG: hydroxyectoine utilization dehydratase EutB [Aggregatilineales bacterium]
MPLQDVVTQQDIFVAQARIRGLVRHTPLIPSEVLPAVAGVDVRLKLETLQPTGSFKVRGAANRILNLSDEARARGVVTVSTGNHGRAVAYVAREIGLKATICVSERVPPNKIHALKQSGAELVIHGQSQDEAETRALELVEQHGFTMIHPFDDPDIITGQGTIGIELLQDFPQLDTVIVPLSGGGLISGIAIALKAANPAIRVIGVSMDAGCVMYHSLRAGKPVQLPEAETLADSLNGGIGLANRYTYRFVENFVDEVVLVSEAEIEGAMARVILAHHMIVEGAGAVPVAGLLSGRVQNMGQHIALILSGGNVDTQTALRISEKFGGG